MKNKSNLNKVIDKELGKIKNYVNDLRFIKCNLPKKRKKECKI